MILNKEAIKQEILIKDACNKQFEDASYTLRIDKIIDMEGNDCKNHYKLKPQGMVYVIFKETIDLSRNSNLIAFAHVKTTLTKRGVMATNIGVIDPGYNGLISTLLINFGNTDFSVIQGGAGLRITFHRIDPVPEREIKSPSNPTQDEYIRTVKSNTDYLDEKFLNLNQVKKEVISTVFERLIKIGVAFTIGSFLVSMYFQIKTSKEKAADKEINTYQLKLNNLQAQFDGLKIELEKKEKEIITLKINDSSSKKQ